MGYPNWSVRMDREGADFTKSTDDYLQWAYGQASLDETNGYALGMRRIREAAERVKARIRAEIERRQSG